MPKQKRYAIVLAAGQGTRMKSMRHKVLHSIGGKPMIEHVIDHLNTVGIDRIIVVVGSLSEQVMEQLGDRVEYVFQHEQLGTAHAVMQAKYLLADEQGTTFVVAGDAPLIQPETLQMMVTQHEREKASVTVLTATLENPFGYGRMIRNAAGDVDRIVEQKDGTAEELAISEVNSGTYCFDNQLLFHVLSQIDNKNAQGEYYLPDCVSVLKNQGHKVIAFETKDPEEIYGVNDRLQLTTAQKIMQRWILQYHMRNGVTIMDPENTYIDADVVIGPDTMIYPGTHLHGKTIIGESCILGPNIQLTDMIIGYECHVFQTVATSSKIGPETSVGPFAYIRPNSDVGSHVKIGNFVEIKNSQIGDYTKVSHLGYVGDATVGQHTNIGCGAITVNYDGINKHRTIIGDRAFVGSNVNLIAPVKVEDGAYVVAGSTITDDVPQNALAIARERQIIKPEYAEKLRKKFQSEKESKK
ncbi:bifunctional UDP-N-acetylglucosamine diphosphorylase/glucosamine-1-phosphate N-acetyltransferase GlmU [Fodinisporobacter ferrooxydans]|uniref:Bifunctional protein GlmU n=1 Tax=Fodinisporobacter ferrooxydans TaxID=2901836 RepID=A0ABY4CMV0_9BACL|nr:bifunctional UDP-N-acetylglucosamine diphosphorylase/glucosamine-1-phosphate N-acetyltransferase GlmU [Alicyclobacillaceae bacterium MYW30-H2]